jgi:hypothetical protein
LGIEHIKLPKTVTVMDDNAFVWGGGLKSLYIDRPEGSIAGAPWGLDPSIITYKQG